MIFVTDFDVILNKISRTLSQAQLDMLQAFK